MVPTIVLASPWASPASPCRTTPAPASGTTLQPRRSSGFVNSLSQGLRTLPTSLPPPDCQHLRYLWALAPSTELSSSRSPWSPFFTCTARSYVSAVNCNLWGPRRAELNGRWQDEAEDREAKAGAAGERSCPWGAWEVGTSTAGCRPLQMEQQKAGRQRSNPTAGSCGGDKGGRRDHGGHACHKDFAPDPLGNGDSFEQGATVSDLFYQTDNGIKYSSELEETRQETRGCCKIQSGKHDF